MKLRQRRQQAFTLIMVLMTMTVVGGFLSMLSFNSVQFHRDRQNNRVQNVARAIADSAAAYVAGNISKVSPTWPPQPIELDVKELLPARMAGSATISFLTIESRRVCRISARAEWGNLVSIDNLDIEIQ